MKIKMRFLFTKFLNDTSGASSIEYALVALLISITIVVSMSVIGAEVRRFFSDIDWGFNGSDDGNIEG